MKTLLIATLLAATTFAASAQSRYGEAYDQTSPTFVSERSRAEVIAELRAAQAAGSIVYGEQPQKIVSAPASSSLTRMQVLREAAGNVPAYGEVGSHLL